MYTQCPACRTLFRITQEQLDAAGGKVRCGECHTVFHAPDHLHQSIVATLPGHKASAPQPATPAPAPQPLAAVAHDDHESPVTTAPDEDVVPEPPPEAEVLQDTQSVLEQELKPDPTPPEPAPNPGGASAAASRPPVELSRLSVILAEQEEPPPRSSLLMTLLWLLGCLLLLSTLALQNLYFQRHALVQQADWRPLLERLCQHVDCQLPPQRDLEAFVLLEHDIRSHEQYQGALTISATLQNNAAYPQPFPVVEVTMHDLGGKVVAARRFPPADYLANTSGNTQLPPQGSAQLLVDIVDPGPEAVGFEFAFH